MATGSDTARTRQRLMNDRIDTVQHLETLTHDYDGVVAAATDVATDDEHDPEGATIAFDRAWLDALRRRARNHLEDIDRALTRLADGSYHSCERCGGVITPARLEARPVARTCIDCASTDRRPA